MHKTIYFLKRLGFLHNISIYFQPYDERRSCNVVETELLVNYTVFVSLAHIHTSFHSYIDSHVVVPTSKLCRPSNRSEDQLNQ